MYKVVGYGFHLIIPRPSSLGKDNLDCVYQKKFTPNQEIFDVSAKDGKKYRIGIPCPLYPDSYTLLYKPLARSWKGKKFANWII